MLQKLKSGSGLLLFISMLLLAGCGKDNNSGGGIELQLIETTTELPAKVRLFFKANLGEENNLAQLTQADFQIFENNSLISALESQAKIQNESGEYLFSTILLLDLSGSVLNGTELPRVKTAATGFIESVMPASGATGFGSKEMAVYWFDGEAEIHLLTTFNTNRDQIIAAINSIDSNISNDNSTNLNGAVMQGISALQNRISETSLDPNVSTAGSIVIFTDGTDQAGRETTENAINAVNRLTNQFSVFTIGLGDEIDENILRRFGRTGFELAFNSFDLNSAFLDVAQEIERESESFYVLEYCSPKRSGDHTIQLRANYEELTGSFSTRFSANGFSGGCTIN